MYYTMYTPTEVLNMSSYIEDARFKLKEWSENIDSETFNKQLSEVLSKEEMLDKKLWDVRVLAEGGVSYFYPEPKLGIDNAVTLELKKRYRVSCTYKDEHTKLLKYKIKKADGEIFSVAAKSTKEAQAVVDMLFGKRMYHVSQMMC